MFNWAEMYQRIKQTEQLQLEYAGISRSYRKKLQSEVTLWRKQNKNGTLFSCAGNYQYNIYN